MRKKHFLFCLILTVLAGLMTACGDDDAPMASYRQDLAEISTNHDGRIDKLILDNADTLLVSNKDAITQTLIPDTVYRVKVAFLKKDLEAEIVGLQSIFSMPPLKEMPEEAKEDAITAEAVWRSGRYLNLLVSFKTSGAEKHQIAFVENGISTQADGSKMLHIVMTHNRRNDGSAYTTKSYLSCLLSDYHTVLTANRDSVSIAIPTGNGFSIRNFPF